MKGLRYVIRRKESRHKRPALWVGVGICLIAGSISAQTSAPDQAKKKPSQSAQSSSREPYYVDGVEYKPYVPETQKKSQRPTNGVDGGMAPAPDLDTYPATARPSQTPVVPDATGTVTTSSSASSSVSASVSSASAPPPRVVAPGVAAIPGALPGAASTTETPAPTNPQKRQRFNIAIVRALDKVTAESVMFEARIGQDVRYKGLVYKVRACETSATEESRPDVIAYLEVRTNEINRRGEPKVASHNVFRGWTFASSPGLNPMQHPIYDAWVIACKAPMG